MALIRCALLRSSFERNACGNCTPIGTSANITGIGILCGESYTAKNSDFFKIGIPFTLAAILLAYIYLWIMYGV